MTEEKQIKKFSYIIRLIQSSEESYRAKDYKEAMAYRIKAKQLIGSEEEYELLFKNSNLNRAKYNLIDDYKKRIDNIKKTEIISKLQKRAELKYNSGDYESAIRAIRRAEKLGL